MLSIYTTLWLAWFYQNKQLSKAAIGDLVVMATNFNKLVADYNEYSTKTFVPQQSRILSFQAWTPPLRGWVKFNSYAHVPNDGVV